MTFWIDKRQAVRVLAYFCIVSLFGFCLLYYVKDGSWDGSTYHLEIIRNFILGIPFLSTDTVDLWAHVYPKDMEILLSIWGSLFPSSIDSGRIIKFVIYGVAFITLVDTLVRFGMTKFRAYLIGIFSVLLHPLILAQFFTKYIDDLLYCFFLLFFASFFAGEYVLTFLLFGLFL